MTDAELGLKTGRVVNRFKMAKHIHLTIGQGHLGFQRNELAIQRESGLDGIYVVRTSQNAERLSAEDAVRSYKSLAQVEQAFRCLKQTDLHIRPIRHHTEDHVRAHVLLCMLAYYVDWHMRRSLAPLLFEDEQLDEDRPRRDPVATSSEASPAFAAPTAPPSTCSPSRAKGPASALPAEPSAQPSSRPSSKMRWSRMSATPSGCSPYRSSFAPTLCIIASCWVPSAPRPGLTRS